MSQRAIRSRYDSIAIAFHWLIALSIIGLLAAGKWMTSLAQDDPLRFSVTQWHKSFGFLVLLLVVGRIIWRLFHCPPALPGGMRSWELLASKFTHFLLYVLILLVPVSGWLMVSISTISLQSLLFGVWPFPLMTIDLPGDQSRWSDQAHAAHFYLSGALMGGALLHILAALRHQLLLRDKLLQRMWVGAEHIAHGDRSHGLLIGLLLVFAGGTVLYSLQTAAPSSASKSTTSSPASLTATVRFTATQMGDTVEGRFEQLNIEFNRDQPDGLRAIIETASVVAADPQIALTLPTEEWFDSAQFAQAAFASTAIVQPSAGNYAITGELTIKGISRPIEFNLGVASGLAAASFTINRNDFNVGGEEQNDYVDEDVQVSLEFVVPREY